MEDDFEDFSGVNSELRYLTLELMKIAVKKGISFKEVCNEFIENVEHLHTTIERASFKFSRKGRSIDG